MAGLVHSKAELLLHCNLCPLQSVGTALVGKLQIPLVLDLEASFDVLADIQILVVVEAHIREVAKKVVL